MLYRIAFRAYTQSYPVSREHRHLSRRYRLNPHQPPSSLLLLLKFIFLFLQILDAWSPKLSHENDGLIFNPAEEVQTITPQLIRLHASVLSFSSDLLRGVHARGHNFLVLRVSLREKRGCS